MKATGRERGKRRRRLLLLGSLFCCVLLLLLLEVRLAPALQAQAEVTVHNQVSALLAETVRQAADREQLGDYGQLMQVSRDEQGRIDLISVDTLRLNRFSAVLLSELETVLSDLDAQRFYLPLFSATGSRFLATYGPELPFRLRGMAAPAVSLQDSFTAAGINQTRHRIYLQVDVELMVAVPFSRRECRVETQVLLAEGLVIGDVPQTYVQWQDPSSSLAD